jgi:hypothetical protein
VEVIISHEIDDNNNDDDDVNDADVDIIVDAIQSPS